MADIDLKEFETDVPMPPHVGGGDWPMLTGWRALASGRVIYLEGWATQHPVLGSGLIRTSAIARIAKDRTWVQTRNTLYALAAPADDSTDRPPQDGIECEDDLIKESESAPLDALRKPVPPATPEPTGPGVVVIPKIGGNARDFRNRPTCEDFRPLEGKRIPLVPVPDLAHARATLAAEFPHACGAIDIMLSDLLGRATFRPTLLAGDPGGGKSRLAARIEVLGLYIARYDGSGSNDASFAGCARHWSTAEPSFALAAVRDSGTANPVILIDEIDKATKSHNGGLAQSLLPLLEGVTASKYPDIYISAPVDLSHVSYILTCNDERLLPKPLRDRLRILRIPVPTVDHIFPLSKTIVGELAKERGIDPAFAQPLDGDEIHIAAGLWPTGGSIRKLRAIIERILARRDDMAPRH